MRQFWTCMADHALHMSFMSSHATRSSFIFTNAVFSTLTFLTFQWCSFFVVVPNVRPLSQTYFTSQSWHQWHGIDYTTPVWSEMGNPTLGLLKWSRNVQTGLIATWMICLSKIIFIPSVVAWRKECKSKDCQALNIIFLWDIHVGDLLLFETFLNITQHCCQKPYQNPSLVATRNALDVAKGRGEVDSALKRGRCSRPKTLLTC